MQPVKAYHERQRRQVHMTIKSGYEIQNNIAASKVHTRGKNYNELKFFSGNIKNPADKKNIKNPDLKSYCYRNQPRVHILEKIYC